MNVNSILLRSTGNNFLYNRCMYGSSYISFRKLNCTCKEKQTGEEPFKLIQTVAMYLLSFDISTTSVICKNMETVLNTNIMRITNSIFYAGPLSLHNFQGGKDTVIFRRPLVPLVTSYYENVSVQNSSFGSFFNENLVYITYFKNISIINSTINEPFITATTVYENQVEIGDIYVENSKLNGLFKLVEMGSFLNPVKIEHIVSKMNSISAPMIYSFLTYIDVSDYNSHNTFCTHYGASDISVSKGEITIKNSYFYSQIPLPSNGYISASDNQNITVIDTTFINGIGKVSSFLNSAISSRLILSNSKFINSLGFSAILSYLDSYIMISGCIFENSTKYSVLVSLMNSNDLIIVDTVFKNSSASAIYLENVLRAKIKSCSFILSSSQQASAFYTKESSSLIGRGIEAKIENLEIEDCYFANMRSDENGGAIYAEALNLSSNYLSSLSIKNTYFVNSSGNIGGAVYIYAPDEIKKKFTGYIDNCIFLNSISIIAGGALGYSCDKKINDCNFSISNSKFINNSVSSLTGGGGAIKYFYDKIDFINNEFQGNYASFATNILGVPSGILVMVGNKTWNSQCLSKNTTDSQWYSSNCNYIFNLKTQEFESIIIYIIDDNEQLVWQSGMSKATISYNTSTDLQITPFSFIEANGVIDFTGMIINGSYGSINNVAVNVSIYDSYYIPSVTMNFSIFIPACTMGEQTTTDRKCIKCPYSKYLYDPGPTCWDCPKNLHCYGGSTVTTTAGYWRFTNTTNFVVSCPNKESCLAGNENNSMGICNTERGFTGIACSLCLPNYLKVTNQCMVCPDSDIINLLFIVLVGFGILAINIYFILDKIPKASTNEAPRILFKKHESIHSIFLKIFVNHILLVTLIAQFNITWPKSIYRVFGSLSQASAPSQAIYSVECFSRSLAMDKDLFYIKLIAAAAFPLVYSLIINIVWKVIHHFYPSIHETDRVIISIVVISMQFHAGLSQTGFLGISYMRIDHDELRVFSDLRISAYDKKYLLLGLPFSLFVVLVWGFGLLAFIFFTLFINRHMITKGDKATLAKYNFLISGYKNQAYFWDLLIQARKFLLALLSSFLIDISPTFQVSLAILLLFIYLYLLIHMTPYKDPNLNKIEGLSCLVCLCQFIFVRNFSE